MKNDRLYIDNVLVDVSENVDITLVHNSNLFRDITKMTGNTTYTIRLPRTANNAAVFGMAGDLRADTTYPTQYHRADYIRGGVPIITGGCAVLLSVTDMYEISISWGAFAPLATIVNDGMTLNQLGGTDTILFAANNKVTDYAQAMTDGYYYALYDPYIRETSTEWVGYDVSWYNQGSQSYSFTNGVVLTASLGETMSLQPTSRTGTQYIVIPFRFGMVCFIDGVTGASDARAWCIVDEANTVIQLCDDLTLISGLSLRSPVNAAYIIINSTTGGTVSVGYRAATPKALPQFTQYADGYARLPVVNVSWILDRIKLDTGVDFVFPYSVKAYLDTLALPLVTAKANALTLGGVTTMDFTLQYALGSVGILATANTLFSEQSGAVFQLTATRSARVVFDVQANYEWNFTSSTPQGTGSTVFGGGVTDTTSNYSFAPTYIEVKIVHTDPDAEDTIYIVGNSDAPSGQHVMQTDKETDNGATFARVIAGYGEVEILSGDVLTFTLKNKIGTIHDFFFMGGQLIISEPVDGDVPRGAQYPIVENLPEIKITDFIQFLCAITACVPLNKQQSGKVEFEEIATLFGAASLDWTTKIIPSNLDYEQAQELTYRINDYARKNWYKWKEDETVLGNYDGYMEINDDTLDADHDVMEFPFAASDGNRVPIFTRGGGGVFGGSGNDTPYEPSTLKGCEPRIMSVYQATNGTAALRFDIDMQDVIDTQMTGMAASLADVRVIKERIRMSDVELAAFDESMPVYLRQYGSFFAVLSLESNGDGTAIASMLRLRKSLAQPVPPPEPPYDYEVDYLESDGLAFIDTGIKASNDVEIQMYLADFFDEQNKNKGAFGGRNGSGSAEFGMMLDNSGNVIIGNGSQITLSPYANYSPRCHVEIGGGVWKIGAATGTYTPSTFESNYNVYLFAMNNSGGAVKGKCKIGATHITNGVDELDLIPVVKNGEGFMYDRISGQLFGNIGTGAFTWGNLPYDYEVEYLKSDGNSYINTGYTPDADTDFLCEFTLPQRAAYVLGFRATSSFGIYCGANNNGVVMYGGTEYKTGMSSTVANANYKASLIGTTAHCNNTTKTISRSAMADALPIYLFGWNISSVLNALSVIISKFVLYQNGVIVMDLIPVVKNNVGYMYDRVTDTLFGNDGTGDFVIGNDV